MHIWSIICWKVWSLIFLYAGHSSTNCWRLICERQRAFYDIKCVLRIYWQTWLHMLMDKKNSTHCKHVPYNTLTHSTNENLLNIKRKGDPKYRTLSRVRYHWNPEPVSNKSHFVSLFYLYWYFFNLLILFWHTDKNFCFFAEVNFWDFVRNDSSIEWD